MTVARTDRLLVFDTVDTEPTRDAPLAARLVAGSPTNLTWNFEDDGVGLYSGVWESTPGEWRVDYSEWEFCHIVAGVSVLKEDGRDPVHLKAGDSFVIRPGFKGMWRVVETTRKHYVIKT